MRVQDISVAEQEPSEEQTHDKEKSEITALEHLSYMNACARMDLINANAKLMNFHILKKYMNKQNKDPSKPKTSKTYFR